MRTAILSREELVVSYKCADKFYGEYDGGIRWDDSDLAIAWPLDKVGGRDKFILSDKDQSLPSFANFVKAENSGFRLVVSVPN